MTDKDHPITPPPKLLQQWWDDTHGASYEFDAVATQAARWGADQELEACCEWFFKNYAIPSSQLRAVRRPKPPSLKEQALEVLELNNDYDSQLSGAHYDIIRRALESLPD